MTSTVRESFDPSTFKLPALDQPPPPRYYDRRGSPISSSDTKTQDDASYTHGPWLLRRTSVHVESTPSNTLEDNLSDHASIATTKSDEKRAVRNLLSRFGRQPSSDQYNDDRISVADSHETSVFGTTVSIEAGQPRKVTTTQREMRGLEQAASVRRWAGDGRPAEAWGKLNKVGQLEVKLDMNIDHDRTPNYGILAVIHLCILDTSAHKHHFDSDHRCWRRRSQTFY